MALERPALGCHTGRVACLYEPEVGGSGGVRFHDGTGSGVLMRLTPDGALGIGPLNPIFQLQHSLDSAATTSNTWTVFSDARLKKNINTEAILKAGVRRCRPIFLTTATTFCGLTPIILETSLQAQYIVPMAISLGFGIVFATAIILLLVPCLYLILKDAMNLTGSNTNTQVENSSRA